jgi:hypothetical protein
MFSYVKFYSCLASVFTELSLTGSRDFGIVFSGNQALQTLKIQRYGREQQKSERPG